jgi:cytochrome c oxidase subunit II
MTMRIFLILIAFALLGVGSASAVATGSLYWAPENVTVGGRKIDGILNFIFWLTVVVFFATQIVYVYYLIRYRRKPGVRAHYSHGNNFLEIIWTTIPVLIFLGLAIYSNRVWGELHSEPPPDAIQINISSYQYGWEMRYGGADNTLGKIDVVKIGKDNRFGVDPADEAGKDDFLSTELVIPYGKPIHILLNARDVIHSFYVPAFRLYQDAVPGRTISWVWFEVTKPGNFELACSQLCGVGHYNMKAPIRVVSPEEYAKWYEGKVQSAAQAALEKSAPAVAHN